MITFTWIPAHRRVHEVVDALTKRALKYEGIMEISLSKFKAIGIIKRNIISVAAQLGYKQCTKMPICSTVRGRYSEDN